MTIGKPLPLAVVLALPTLCVPSSAVPYDPMAGMPDTPVAAHDLRASDVFRQREIPLRVYLPVATTPAPVMLFSHGLGGSREGSAYLGRHWAARGYVAVFLQHPGSDEAVWREVPPAERMAVLREAASGRNLLERVRDVVAVLDELSAWQTRVGHVLAGRMDLARIGMSGHSFGAVTTQAVSGQSYPGVGPRMTDLRIKAAIAFSPSAPVRGDPAEAFGAVKIPWMLMTGTKDTAAIGGQSVESRLKVYPSLPDIPKYELVLFEAEHSAFTERPLPGEGGRRNPNHHRAILALSTAFWDVHLRGDAAAREWLHGEGARAILEAQDRWRFSVPGGTARRLGESGGSK